MEQRKLGRTELTIPPLVFGGNVFGWTADRDTSFALLDRMVDAGLSAIDTADMYSRWVPGNVGGESETIIGDWIASRGKRDAIVLITKVGVDMGEVGKGLSAAHIESAVEGSLRRLRTDRIDVYLSHLYDDEVALEETLTAHDRLVRAGVPCAPIRDVPAALADPHTAHRGMVVAIGEHYRGVASPIKLSRTPASYRLAPPSRREGGDT